MEVFNFACVMLVVAGGLAVIREALMIVVAYTDLKGQQARLVSDRMELERAQMSLMEQKLAIEHCEEHLES